MTTRWCGPRAFLLECADLREVLGLHASLARNPFEGQIEAIAAARTVLLTFADARAAARAAERADGVRPEPPGAGSAGEHLLDVVYDGADVNEVAEQTGLSPEAVIATHTGQTWTAAFGGFAPGFFYLTGENEALAVPRRASPRTAVPPGAVGLAGEFSAVYPRESPGGWQLIGRTAERMFDLNRPRPALLSPGARVRFRAVRESIPTAAHVPSPEPAPVGAGMPPVSGDERGSAPYSRSTNPASGLEVVDPGLGLLVQDLGRAGLGDIGVGASGAADAAAAAQANRLLGNPPGAAVLESILGNFRVRAGRTLVLALTGAPAGARIDGDRARPAPALSPFALREGETLTVDAPEAGLRVYLGVRGGIDVPPVLGSRSHDTLAGLGPTPLGAGDTLPAGPAPRESVRPAEERTPMPSGTTVLRVNVGPREDWFPSLSPLFDHAWISTAKSNRVGVRLDLDPEDPGAAPLARSGHAELPSEGVVAGSLQVPPSGLPVLFLADHPVTGGYPVIGVVVREDLGLAAQLPPGATVRFVLHRRPGHPEDADRVLGRPDAASGAPTPSATASQETTA